jgi:hypothetical protein
MIDAYAGPFQPLIQTAEEKELHMTIPELREVLVSERFRVSIQIGHAECNDSYFTVFRPAGC